MNIEGGLFGKRKEIWGGRRKGTGEKQGLEMVKIHAL